jgi:hypothetical protein
VFQIPATLQRQVREVAGIPFDVLLPTGSRFPVEVDLWAPLALNVNQQCGLLSRSHQKRLRTLKFPTAVTHIDVQRSLV